MVFFHISLGFQLYVLLGSFLSGIAPFFILRRFFKNDHDGCRKNRTLALLIYFGGGVFMSTCFIILQPKANREYHLHSHPHCSSEQKLESDSVVTNSEGEGHKEGFPVSDFIILCGFILLFIIEEGFQFVAHGLRKETLERSRKIPFCSCAKRHTECSRTFKAANPTEQTLFGLEKQANEPENESPYNDCLQPIRNNDAGDAESRLLQSSIISQTVPNYGAIATITELNTNQQQIPILAPPIIIGDEGKLISQLPDGYRPYTTFFLLAIVLATQNFFEGLALGNSVNCFAWNRFIRCTIQIILSFAVGSVISQDAEASLPVICYIGLLSLMCPIGISLRIIFNNAFEISHLAQAIINANLCGGLLYLTFFDVLRGLPQHYSSSQAKFVCFTLGAAFIGGLNYLIVIT